MNDCFITRDFVNDDASATITDYGAHVLDWTPNGQPKVLWHPRAITLSNGVAIRGGIPLVFPWFNSGFENGHVADKQPKHGFARISFWHFDEASSSNAVARYTLTSDDVPDDLLRTMGGGEKASFHATYEVRCSKEFQASFTVTNDGEHPFSYDEALHTYLHVGDVRRISVTGLEGATYFDTTIEGHPTRVQPDEPITFDGTMTDSIYQAASDGENAVVRVHDETLGRTIVVEKSGSHNTVVWNPGEQGAAGIGDIANDEWPGFVCVEAANNHGTPVTLAPGESHTLSQTLRVE
ncbi:D-hexose-6-phosphate mutarotase [Bifidobacterium sp. SMB2]|uniref:Putative glucose-6-phosphate 1-epimerase n=1 Tax=Bifidobacterium saimiriisciurei TaxID=2661627 RepID=A0ABX0CA19_9BIFI|nr:MULTISPECIES: D-hexose-6-phosphate mutarotase [Bifidobacterium]NEG97036.1 D-hexose-6-phosphate mutarotase [Bifidobacterium sp. SMB2]NEH11981.1 D-hexose-6-phosphate mutarotase [Bifidobacterium saimiriisciurei]